MSITFENENDVIVYALEKIITFARNNRYIFLAQSVWWISSILGLQQGLIVHIDNIRERSNIRDQETREISATPRDLQSERADIVLNRAEQFIKESEESRKTFNTRQRNRVNPLPQTKLQLKKARRVKRLQEENRKNQVERNRRLQEIRHQVTKTFDQE
jgi:hypothetical protein